MNDVLERFHRTLVEEIRTRRPGYLSGPFTVAEIYQNLVPYGSHRDRIGVEMNGDYEDALLRLLAGEGDYLLLDSEHALRELREELETANPNTGVYREFAAVDVRLNPDRLEAEEGASREAAVDVLELAPEAAEVPGPQGAGQAAGAQASLAEEAAEAAGSEVGPASFWSTPAEPDATEAEKRTEPLAAPERLPDDAPDAAADEAGDDADVDSCRWCRAELPEREHLNFCPYCGTDVRLVPCPACGEELQPDWRFCIACGTEVEA